MSGPEPTRTPTRKDIERLHTAQNNAAALAKQELGQLWMKIDGYAPEFQRDALLEWVPAIIGKYSGMSRDAASDWYKEVRDQWFDGETVPRAKEVPDGSDELRRIMRAQMGLLWKDNDEGELLRYLNGVIDRNVNEIARDGIMSCAKQDKRKPKFARVPLGPTCAWCMMLAGRGWVYGSSEKAGAGFNKFHADCDCQIVPSWSTHPQVDGYDPDGIEQRYLQCRSTIENDLQKRYKQERKVYRDGKGKEHHESLSDFEERAILAEMRWRDKRWFYDGTRPMIQFETPQLELETRHERPQELRTAARLRNLGIAPNFQVDTQVIIDSEGKRKRVGLADLQGGTEIKTLASAASKNTLNGYLKNTSKKKDAVRVIFDNTENESMDDVELIAILRKSQSFSRGTVYIIAKDGKLIRIR